MAIGLIYPRFTARRTFHLEQDALYTAVKSAFHKLGWPYKLLWGREFQAQVPTTNWSWHHDVKVEILQNGVVQAESRSAYSEVFFDFGRNRRNVEALFAHIQQAIEDSQSSPL